MRAKDNPFSSDQIESLPYRFTEGNWETFIEKLAENNFRGSIIGPEGSGKSTFLQTLSEELSERGFDCTLHAYVPGFGKDPIAFVRLLSSQANSETVVLLDGADHLPKSAFTMLERLSRHWKGLVVTSHEKVLIQELWRCETDPVLFEQLVSALTSSHSLKNQAANAFEHASGNVREAFLSLYDRASELKH